MSPTAGHEETPPNLRNSHNADQNILWQLRQTHQQPTEAERGAAAAANAADPPADVRTAARTPPKSAVGLGGLVRLNQAWPDFVWLCSALVKLCSGLVRLGQALVRLWSGLVRLGQALPRLWSGFGQAWSSLVRLRQAWSGLVRLGRLGQANYAYRLQSIGEDAFSAQVAPTRQGFELGVAPGVELGACLRG